MKTKYGYYSSSQIGSIKLSIRRSIYYLLLYVDPETREEYPDVNVEKAFYSLQCKINGLNSILLEPVELVETMSLLEAAYMEYTSKCFSYQRYRKLILDAGAKIMKVKEGD